MPDPTRPKTGIFLPHFTRVFTRENAEAVTSAKQAIEQLLNQNNIDGRIREESTGVGTTITLHLELASNASIATLKDSLVGWEHLVKAPARKSPRKPLNFRD